MVLTLPKFRRHGVATALRRHYFADAFRRGARYVWYRTDLPWFREPALTFHFRLFVRLPLLTRLLRPARRRWFQARRLRVAPNDSRWR